MWMELRCHDIPNCANWMHRTRVVFKLTGDSKELKPEKAKNNKKTIERNCPSSRGMRVKIVVVVAKRGMTEESARPVNFIPVKFLENCPGLITVNVPMISMVSVQSFIIIKYLRSSGSSIREGPRAPFRSFYFWYRCRFIL